MSMSKKAQSLQWIESNISKHALPTILISSQSSVRDVNAPFKYPLFMRTCPTNTQHGLLDSFQVNSREEYDLGMRCLLDQMSRQGEQDGIIAIQPYCPAIANIVWAPGIMAIGPGHNGVTAGLEPVITVNIPPPAFYDQAIRELGISAAEIEMVVDSEMRVLVTQVRHATGHFCIDQPPLHAIPGFLQKSPLKLTDCYIQRVRCLGDIAILCKLPSRPDMDVIVSHPNGSMLSHAAAWCRQRGYSYAVTDLVKHLSCMTDYDKEAWLHEPSRGWLVCGPSDLSAPTAIDYYRGTFFRGLEYALGASSLEELRSRWITLQPFLYYSTGKVITREMAGLAGVFTGTLLRSVLVLSVDMAHRTETLCHNIINIEFLKKSYRIGQDGPLDLSHPQIGEVMATLRAIFKDHSFCIWQISDENWHKWHKMITCASSLLAVFEDRDRSNTVSSATTLLNCVADLQWAFVDTFGQDMLDLPCTDSADWSRTAQLWARCLMILQDLNLSCHEDMASFMANSHLTGSNT
ncbi:MAG: hypothetical protein WC405_03895 [Syntrophales bacterium]